MWKWCYQAGATDEEFCDGDCNSCIEEMRDSLSTWEDEGGSINTRDAAYLCPIPVRIPA